MSEKDKAMVKKWLRKNKIKRNMRKNWDKPTDGQTSLFRSGFPASSTVSKE